MPVTIDQESHLCQTTLRLGPNHTITLADCSEACLLPTLLGLGGHLDLKNTPLADFIKEAEADPSIEVTKVSADQVKFSCQFKHDSQARIKKGRVVLTQQEDTEDRV